MNLRTQIQLLICSIIIILMTSLGAIIYVDSAKIINNEAESYMIAQLDRTQENIDMLVRINMLETKQLSLDKKVQAFLEKKIKDKEMNSYLSELLKGKNKQDNYYMDLFILNNDGVITATCMSTAMNLDLSTREYFRRSARTKSEVISDILVARSNGSLVVNTLSPVIDLEGHVLGYAGIAIYADYFSDTVNNLKLGQAGYYSIIDSNNLILAHPNRSLIGKSSIFDVTNAVFKDKQIIKESKIGLNNTKEFQIFKHIENMNWILVAALPQKDMYVKSKSLLINVVLIGLVALMVAIFIGIYISKKISTPIEAITKYMNIILKGSTTFGRSLSESMDILRKNYENISEEKIEVKMEQNEYYEITKLSQSFSNLKRQLWLLLKNFEKEGENLIETTKKMALTIDEIYNGTSRFILTLSHDLKNSITVIKGYSKGLKMGIVEDENVKQDFINGIYERTEELEKIIYDVLDSAYEAQQSIKIHKEPVSIEEYTTMIVESAKQYIENSDIQFSAKINIKPGFLYIDKTKIKRVWNNLINNAVKYSAKGSLITVRIDSEGNKIKFEIEDEGIGIDQDKLNKIFNIFFRCEEIDKKGYGLGLFICKSIIEAHRSNLNVKSEKGKGSTFWFYIDTN